ncbi:MAG: hypothetical protein PHD30_00455 [Paludibacter sp.]|nr:hypothetical protein [Paludibacter sp.]
MRPTTLLSCKKLCYSLLILFYTSSTAYGSYVDQSTAQLVAMDFLRARITRSPQARLKFLAAQQLEMKLVNGEFADDSGVKYIFL